MRIYTLYRRPGLSSSEPEVTFVKEGFCWPAFLLPVIWPLWHRQWLALVAYAGGAAALMGAALFVGESASLILALGYGWLVGASANDWRRARLRAQGYRFEGVYQAVSLAAAEERYFQASVTEGASVSATRPVSPANSPPFAAARRRPESAAPLAPWSP